MPKESGNSKKIDPFKIYRRLYRAYGRQHWWPAKTPFEVIIGAILTQNTAWTNVEKAIKQLKASGLLTLSAMRTAPDSKLKKAIRSSGFFNQKAKRLKAFIRYLDKHHSGDLKSFVQSPLRVVRADLLNIHGIGPETADSILLYAAEKPVFVVDSYTRRIFSRMGWKLTNAPYEDIRRFFETSLQGHQPDAVPTPAENNRTKLYNEYHALIVRHAKNHCRKKPLCHKCPLNSLCSKCI